MDKKQKEAQSRQEDIALTRGLLWVGGAIVLEALLLLVNRYYINFRLDEVDTAELILNTLSFLRIGGVVAAVAALVWAVLNFRKGGKITLPVIAALVCGALAICAHVTVAFNQTGMQMLLMLVPAWAGLALVFYIYQREFFLGAVASGLSVLGLWFVRYGGGLGLEAVLCVGGVLAVAALALWLKKNNGKVSRADGSQARVMSKKTSYPMILCSCGVGLAAILLAMVAGANIAYYLIFAMIVWLFALLVRVVGGGL